MMIKCGSKHVLGQCAWILLAVALHSAYSQESGAAATRPETRGESAVAREMRVIRSLFELGERETARRRLVKLAAREDADAEVFGLLGMVLVDVPFADLDGANEAFHRALTMKPDHIQASFGMGVVASRRRDYREARSYFEKVTQLAVDYPEGWFELGRASYQMGDLDVAESCFRRLAGFPGAYEHRALIKSRQGDNLGAALILEELATSFPAHKDKGRWAYQRGAFLLMADDREAAASAMKQALALGFVRAEVLFELGRILDQVGDTEQGARFLEDSLDAPSIDPGKSRPAIHAQAKVLLGVIAYRKRDDRAALKLFESVVEAAPFHETAWYKLGQVRQRLGLEGAGEAFERHKVVQPMIQAIRSARATLDNDPDDQKTRRELSRLLRLVGEDSEALEHLLILDARAAARGEVWSEIIEVARRLGMIALVQRYESLITERQSR